MGRWIRRQDVHTHDMPGPIILGNQEAVPGWEWECSCLLVFMLKSYNKDAATWVGPDGRDLVIRRGAAGGGK